MRKLFILSLAIVFPAVLTGSVDAQPQPSMYTLDNIYYYLAEGTEATWGEHSLVPPQSGVPGQNIPGYTKSLEDIYYHMSDSFGRCDLSPDLVMEGYYFFSTDTNYWGMQVGTRPWELNEIGCNLLSGWAWYSTNGREACWSKTLADSISWSKGVGMDSATPGSYTAATGYTLKERLEAAAAGEWYKIVSSVNGITIDSGFNGQSGTSYISALAIADCVDGTRDLCSTNDCLGYSWSTINTSLRTWAGAGGKSALPYLGDDAGSTGNNDFETACGQSSSNDRPLGCTDGLFHANRKVCGDGGTNYSWAAACGDSSGDGWEAGARLLGHDSCSSQYVISPPAMMSFRVVVRPVATPSMTPTPVAMPTPQTWYDIYGPSGTGDVVKIGSMYVASDKNGTGCANNGTKNWATACSWGDGLSWLGETDWRLPSKSELETICSNKGSLASYQSDYYWSTTGYDASIAWRVHFDLCSATTDVKAHNHYVRAVRCVLNETDCNALSGWAWYSTNGREACWSKTLADSVSWNKGIGNDSRTPGPYTAATGYTLKERMEAAAAGEWYKIVSSVNGITITSSHNGSAGYFVISALAIADCVDGTRDLCPNFQCLGDSWSTINDVLRYWAGNSGKSALPYLGDDAGSPGNNDYEIACGQSSSNDRPLGCTDGLFHANRKVCGDGETNFSWAAACGSSSGADWSVGARILGSDSCSSQGYSNTSVTGSVWSFRVVVRPTAE